MWLEENGFKSESISDEVNVISLDLEREYETSNESKGASQNDITLIAYAKQMGKTVVTFEGPQINKPGKKCNYRIPLICHEQGVECIDFMKMIDRLNIRT